jgi:tetratricopeptide (TPR) repeat protein
MTVLSSTPAERVPGLRPRMHVLLTFNALFAVALQMMFRVPGSRALSVIPLLNLILIGLHGLLIMKAVLWRGRRRDLVPAFLLSIERASAAAVLVFVGYGLFLLVNATLSSSLRYHEAAEVAAISGGETEFWGALPYAWADLRIQEASGRVERVLLRPHERRSLWGGESVVLQLRRGYFNVPWVMNINPDAERQSQAVLRVTPRAARALYVLTHFYLARMRWEEATATAITYVSLYPDDNSVARHIGEILEAADRFPDMVAVLERVRHPDYDVSVLLGRALARVNRAPEGITVLERATSLQPDEPDAYRQLGLIHLAAGDMARAVRMFERVLWLQPRSPDVQAQLRRLRKGR